MYLARRDRKARVKSPKSHRGDDQPPNTIENNKIENEYFRPSNNSQLKSVSNRNRARLVLKFIFSLTTSNDAVMSRV